MKAFFRKLILVFISAFILNWIWEHLHSALYVHYQGGEITNFILFRAALADGLFISLIFLASYFLSSHYRPVFIFFAGLTLAILIEWWALASGRWAYGPAMPIVPIIQTGLTPTIQLALLGLILFFVTKK